MHCIAVVNFHKTRIYFDLPRKTVQCVRFDLEEIISKVVNLERKLNEHRLVLPLLFS